MKKTRGELHDHCKLLWLETFGKDWKFPVPRSGFDVFTDKVKAYVASVVAEEKLETESDILSGKKALEDADRNMKNADRYAKIIERLDNIGPRVAVLEEQAKHPDARYLYPEPTGSRIQNSLDDMLVRLDYVEQRIRRAGMDGIGVEIRNPYKPCHDGDCTIYDSLDNPSPGYITSGICTCGYGLELRRHHNYDETFSKEKIDQISG